MNDLERTFEAITPVPIVVGEKLPGLLDGDELPEGRKYWNQRIDSPFGVLTFKGSQLEHGHVLWKSEDGHMIQVDALTGVVTEITPPKSH